MKTSNKTISLEAAKLLGLPFRWNWSTTIRFVPTPTGLAVERWYEDGNGWTQVYDTAELQAQDVVYTSMHFSNMLPYVVRLDDEDH